jgi:histidinol dehydrogenase
MSAIIENVQTNDDVAPFALTERFDHQKLSSLCISREEIAAAYYSVAPELVQALIETAGQHHSISRAAEKQDPVTRGNETGDYTWGEDDTA